MTTGSNYGCAMNSNLAAMIANPNDWCLARAASAAAMH
jgi:type IV pilus biogenesis protein CpaD/CtpE